MLEMKRNQHQKIIEYLETHPNLTSYEAYTKLGITQFATRIGELEEKGWSFKKEWDYNINLKGEKKRFKRYSLEEMIEENMNHIPNIL